MSPSFSVCHEKDAILISSAVQMLGGVEARYVVDLETMDLCGEVLPLDFTIAGERP